METESFIAASLANAAEINVQFVASDSMETRRIPDPYVFVLKDRKLALPTGEIVENNVDCSTRHGFLEFIGFQNIQTWANENNNGFAVWFSPPLAGYYPNSKLVISELNNGILFNRAIVLDIDGESLLNLANNLAVNKILNPENLRPCPIFTNIERINRWIDNYLLLETGQVSQIRTGADLRLKAETLVALSSRKSESYGVLLNSARRQGLIGEHLGSCPTVRKQTAFEALFQHGKRILECKCDLCNQRVQAEIYNGEIHCPSCGGHVPYNC